MPVEPRYTVSLDDIRDPTGERLLAVLQRLLRNDYALLEQVSKPLVTATTAKADVTGRLVSLEQALQSVLAGGSQSAIPGQKASVPAVTALPPVASAADGDLVFYNGGFYRFNIDTNAWETSALPAGMMTTNTVQAVTATKTWTAGQINSTAQFRSRAHNSAAQTIGNAAYAALTFDTNDEDVGGVHSTTVNTSRFTVPVGGAGVWFVVGTVNFTANVVGSRGIKIRKNGATDLKFIQIPTTAVVGTNTAIQVVGIDSAAADADYYEFFVFQDSGGGLNTFPNLGCTDGEVWKLG